ncbi:TetR/AcrR family transcriptional regulator [Mycolicibacterium mucogenicum]|uniref:TetR/AcrR family transcriptional regulator n=1 Tax=Mycolicibacterium mucogenicum TaxID=56689 RepID=UPI00226ABE0E|nr:TetR/AcrR family transcriptional regulator [Mycolicibacterium mucogenicum]MCX8564424.1 TetR/AcrR family transcriptional regulator [Mycolicibacterium mucogenicum]
MLRAVISSTAEKGIGATTVADIVGRARVSRQAFYNQFDSKDECLVAAIDAGIDAVIATIDAALASASNLTARQRLSVVVEQYLETCSAEPEFARAWAIDLPAVRPAGITKRNEYLGLLADGLRSLYWPPGPNAPNREVFLAAIGGCHELFYRQVVEDGSDSFMSLHVPIMDFLERALSLPRTD